MSDRVRERIDREGPRKILACDGGGIRGLMSVEILARLEGELRQRLGRDDLVLADWFDLVCGTSTGAIIAACISAGMSMNRIREFYIGSGRQMFDRASLFSRLKHRYDDEPLARKLKAELDRALGHQPTPQAPHATLGSPALRTLLMMVMRNHSTDSPWPVWNHPDAKYNRRTRDDGSPRHDCNLDLPLWQLVRASTAAPTFFPPEVVTFAEGTPHEYAFIFVDGGVTTYNNPAFLAFQMATAAPYQLNWPTGADRMLIVSVGTGGAPAARPELSAGEMNLLHHATTIPSALMNAASAGWDMACRTLGDCRHGARIDSEYGDMVRAGDQADRANWSGAKLFTYLRYNPDLTQRGLAELGLPQIDPQAVQKLDAVQHLDALQQVGRAYASRAVRIEHLQGFA